MKKIISISEIVASIQVKGDLCEIWASADASYHEGKLEVKLDSFLRRARDNERFSADWLPAAEKVIEHVGLEEGSPAAKEIFGNWVERVRRAISKRSAVEISLPS